MTTTRRRVARKAHRCGCGTAIKPGHVYLVHTVFPGDDSGYADLAGHPLRLPECAECAARYGRDYLLGNIPEMQEYRYWLADGPQGPDPFDPIAAGTVGLVRS